MKRLLGLFLVLSLFRPVFSQAVPEASPTPAHHQQQSKSGAALGSITGACAPDYYRNVDGVCVHRPVRTQNSAVPPGQAPNVVTAATRFHNTDTGRVRITAGWSGGCDVRTREVCGS